MSISPMSNLAKQIEQSQLLASSTFVYTNVGSVSVSQRDRPRRLASDRTCGSCMDTVNAVTTTSRTMKVNTLVAQIEITNDRNLSCGFENNRNNSANTTVSTAIIS